MNNKLRHITALSFSLGAVAATALCAGPAVAAPPSISAATATEGGIVPAAVRHKCKVKKCTYTVTTVDGSATAGADYVAAMQSGKRRKRKTFSANLAIQTVNDDTCEPTETFTVRVHLVNRKGAFDFDATETIVDDDCKPAPPAPPAPPASPAPPVAIPANPPGAEVTGFTGDTHSSRLCSTLAQSGTPAPGPFGLRLDPCYVWATCPAAATPGGCRAGFRGEVAGEGPDPVWHVDGWNNGRVYDPDGTERGREAVFCNGYGGCRAQSGEVPMAPGQTIVVECGGALDPNRVQDGEDRRPGAAAKVSCVLGLAWD